MTEDEYYNLNIDDIIYNETIHDVGRLRSCWSPDKVREKTDALFPEQLDTIYRSITCYASECEDWHLVTDSSPDWVRLAVLQERFMTLEQFVYSRLH